LDVVYPKPTTELHGGDCRIDIAVLGGAMLVAITLQSPALKKWKILRVRSRLINVCASLFLCGTSVSAQTNWGLTVWPNKIVTLRPEIRFDHSYDTAAFDNGARRNQFVPSMDFIIHF
jgi:hypothetical protein